MGVGRLKDDTRKELVEPVRKWLLGGQRKNTESKTRVRRVDQYSLETLGWKWAGWRGCKHTTRFEHI